MNQLINVTYENDRITVLARDLHEFLDVSSKFNDWFKRMCGYGFDDNSDFVAITQKKVTAQGNESEYTDYQMTVEMAKEIAMIQRNEKGKQARQYFIECEKQLQQPKSMEDIMIYQLQEMKRLKEQTQEAKALATEVKEEIQGMRDVITLSPSCWRKGTSTIITRIAQKLGGNEYIQTVRQESYNLLEERGHYNLKQRLTNRRKTLADNGISKSKRDKMNKLDIIESDPRILECYLAVVKEMAIKYGITVSNTLTVPAFADQSPVQA